MVEQIKSVFRRWPGWGENPPESNKTGPGKSRSAAVYLFLVTLIPMAGIAVFAQAQWGPQGGGASPSTIRSGPGLREMGGNRPAPPGRSGVPEWTIDNRFDSDIFTFVRIEYDGAYGRSTWRVDYPAADLNFSYRLEELTSMKVHPDGRTMRLENESLHDYPFIFMIDARHLYLSGLQVEILRNYLDSGGFLMMDDLWGNVMLNHISGELRKVFPDRELVELPLEHELFHCVFDLDVKPQVPSEDAAHDGAPFGITWETNIGEPDENLNTPHYKAILDDDGRIMVLVCHNTDLSDGWEEEGISEWFFTNFSEKYSYPLGINIIYYCMTH